MTTRDTRRILPDGWRWFKLGELCHFINGNAYSESDWSKSGIPIIRIQNLNDASKPFNYWSGDLSNRVCVEDGDLLLAWSGTPGTSFGAHIWERGLGVLNQHIFLVKFRGGNLDSRWAKHAINYTLVDLISAAHGAVGLAHVTRREVEALAIPLPPLAEQRRIAELLKEQMAVVDRARASAQARLEAAKRFPSSLLRKVFPKPGQNLPDDWRWVRLGDKTTLLPSKSIASDGDSQVQAVTTACLTECSFNPNGIKPARMWAHDMQDCMISAGEVLIARSNTPELVGRACLFDGIPEKIVASDLTIRIQADRDLLPHFLSGYLSSLFVRGYWREQAGGASGSMKKITRAQVINLMIPHPPLREQQRIAAVLRDQMAAVEKTRAGTKAEMETINALPAALLRKAFNGDL